MQTAGGLVNAARRIFRAKAGIPARPRSPPVNNLLTCAPVRWTPAVSKHLKNVSVVSGLTMISRVLGLVRESLVAHVFGTQLMASAFNLGFRFPNLFRRLLAEGALTASFVPALQEELRDRGRSGAFALVSNVASWLLLVSGALVAVAMGIFHGEWLVPADDPEGKWRLAYDLTVILFPYLILICLSAVCSAALQVLDKFTEPALSPIWLNLAMIGSLCAARLGLAGTELAKVHWLCAGALVGGGLQFAVPAAVLIREGWRPRLDLAASPRVRMMVMMMAPGVVGTAIYQVNQVVAQTLAYGLAPAGPSGAAGTALNQVNQSDAANAVLNYASRLMELPIGVFTIAITTVVYPLLARHAAEKNFGDMAKDYHKGLRLVLLINLPAAVGLAMLAQPIIRVIYESGRFNADSTALTVPVLQIYALSMPFFSVVSLTTRAFYATRDTVTPVKIALMDLFLNAGLCLALRGPLGISGFAWAGTISVIVQAIVLQVILAQKLPGMTFSSLWPTVGKVGAAAAVMGAAVIGMRALSLINPDSGKLIAGIELTLVIGAAAALYFTVAWFLRVEGREEFAELWAKIRNRIRP